MDIFEQKKNGKSETRDSAPGAKVEKTNKIKKISLFYFLSHAISVLITSKLLSA